ncbi:antitrypsin-like [Hyposmocoma kahamanoa]|uniref:antitrypsin-like n=1 Tax=Hyposmocoma kahamanoa TaxID=1477025 RepID=UPI000E6DA495|nr:antitrypsin-like [Hyposmocoma kahamanoa]
MPLGKLVLGASNNTLQELLVTLGTNNLNETKLHFKYVINQLLRMANVTINIYSVIYVNDKYEIQNKFTDDAIEIFGAGVGSLNFSDPAKAAKIINKWVSKQTNDTIHKVIKESALTPDAKIVLVNAVYFSGQWRFPFEKTQKEVFYAQGGPQQVNMMLTVADFFYYESKFLKAQVIQLPYLCYEGMTMIIFLPISNSSEALEVLLETINGAPAVLDSVLKSMKIHRVHVSLPRFKIYTNFNLGEQYEKVGLKSLFHEGLNKMVKDKDIFVSKAVQTAVIQVNENGTMAASASTTVNMISNDEDVPPVAKFIANHPFHFIVLARNEQLFSGVLNNIRQE